MTLFHTLFFGIVEGLTEFLPISSTAHLDISRILLGIPATEFIKSFEIIIQLGAILAVVLLYREKLFKSWKYFRNIVIAFIPTGIIGFLLYKVIKTLLLGNAKVEALALLIGGLIILFFENRRKHIPKPDSTQMVEDLTVPQLLTIGTAQALAVIPGVSRSGAVFVCGRIMKLKAEVITEFSFLLAVPTMLAASAYDVYKSGLAITRLEWFIIFIGFVTSFLVALFVIKWLINYVKTHTFNIFGWYRIVVGILMLLFLLK
ncbi:MAG: undecaprenyl-diphosphate phosphatase [bacterium]